MSLLKLLLSTVTLQILKNLDNKKSLDTLQNQGFEIGTPGRNRTLNLLIRSQTLYPIELRVHQILAYKYTGFCRFIKTYFLFL